MITIASKKIGNNDKICLDDCKDVIIAKLYKILKDKHCFYHYHVNDKTKSATGESIATINEIILDKPDTKMIKDLADVICTLDKDNKQGKANPGIVVVSRKD